MYGLLLEILPSKSIVIYFSVPNVVQGGQDVWPVTGNITF